jgi:hypothetical protein
VGADSDLPRGPRAAPGGHLDVQQSNIRAFAKDEIDRLLGVLRNADELEGAVRLDELGESGTNHRLVVRYDYADSIHELTPSAFVKENTVGGTARRCYP